MEAKNVSVTVLAYLGDSVLELLVRRRLVEGGLTTSAHLTKAAFALVSAPAQAEAAKRILPSLSEEEEDIFRRGRNLHHKSVPKRATVGEYCAATGFEAVFGYLYLSGEEGRIGELFALAYPEEIEKREETK